jgi:mannose/fructose/N-acetylgalactosamine-specific phosphotransferase system component IIC
MSLWLLLLLVVFIFLASLDQYVGFEILHQPLIVAFVLGLIFQRLDIAMTVGFSVQLMTLSSLAIGGVQPPNRFVFGFSAVLLAVYIFEASPMSALVFAYPFAYLGKIWAKKAFSMNVKSFEDLSAQNENLVKLISRVHYLAAVRLGLGFLAIFMSLWMAAFTLKDVSLIGIEGLFPIFEKSSELILVLSLVMLYRQLEAEKSWIVFLSSIIALAVLNLWFHPLVSFLVVMILVVMKTTQRSQKTESEEEGI